VILGLRSKVNSAVIALCRNYLTKDIHHRGGEARRGRSDYLMLAAMTQVRTRTY
jgi:hypothetical protein